MDLTLRDLVSALKDHEPVTKIRRHDLTDEQWEAIRSVIPRPENRRGLPRQPRRLLNGMLWILRTGAPWRDLPDRYGPWKTVWCRFVLWRETGVLDDLKGELLKQLNDAGKIDWDLWCIDGTSVRASRAATGARKKGARTMSRQTTPSGDLEAAMGRRSTS